MINDVKFRQIPENHKKALKRIYEEYLAACKQHPNFNSPHEAYAIIKEELDEVWDIIKNTRLPHLNQTNENRESMKSEVVAVGAMAMRFMIDL